MQMTSRFPVVFEIVKFMCKINMEEINEFIFFYLGKNISQICQDL